MHFAAQQKVIQQCKATILQSNSIKGKKRLAQKGFQSILSLGAYTNTTAATVPHDCAVHELIVGFIKMTASWNIKSEGPDTSREPALSEGGFLLTLSASLCGVHVSHLCLRSGFEVLWEQCPAPPGQAPRIRPPPHLCFHPQVPHLFCLQRPLVWMSTACQPHTGCPLRGLVPCGPTSPRVMVPAEWGGSCV